MHLTIKWKYNQQEHEQSWTDKSEIVVGRPKADTPLPDLNLPDEKVSRPHLRLKYYLNTWWVEDAGSKRGATLNGQQIAGLDWQELHSHDVLVVGDTTMTVEFTLKNNPKILEVENERKGIVESFALDQGDNFVAAEDGAKSIRIIGQFHKIMSYAAGQNLLRAYIEKLREVFPHSAHITIALLEGEDKEIVPREFYPNDVARISLKLMRETIQKSHVVCWQRSEIENKGATLDNSDMMYAMYAPMIVGDEVIGALHLDTNDANNIYSKADAQLLETIASTMAMGYYLSKRVGTVDEFPSVFLSYKTENYAFVVRLEKDLRKRRIRPWFDDNLEIGEVSWQRRLAERIENTDAFIVVLSDLATKSENVLWEIRTALHYNKAIFPVFIEKCEMPPELIGRQAAMMYLDQEDAYHRELPLLVQGIQKKFKAKK